MTLPSSNISLYDIYYESEKPDSIAIPSFPLADINLKYYNEKFNILDDNGMSAYNSKTVIKESTGIWKIAGGSNRVSYYEEPIDFNISNSLYLYFDEYSIGGSGTYYVNMAWNPLPIILYCDYQGSDPDPYLTITSELRAAKNGGAFSILIDSSSKTFGLPYGSTILNYEMPQGNVSVSKDTEDYINYRIHFYIDGNDMGQVTDVSFGNPIDSSVVFTLSALNLPVNHFANNYRNKFKISKFKHNLIGAELF